MTLGLMATREACGRGVLWVDNQTGHFAVFPLPCKQWCSLLFSTPSQLSRQPYVIGCSDLFSWKECVFLICLMYSV